MSVARVRSLLALSVSMALSTAGCTKADSTGEPAAEPKPAEANADGAPADDAKTEVVAKAHDVTTDLVDAVDEAVKPGALADTVAAMVEAKASYPIELDPLLDLVAADPSAYAVIRDVDDLLSVSDALLVPMDAPLRRFAATIEAAGKPGPVADVAKFFDGYAGLRDGLRGPDFDLTKGMVMTGVDGESVLVYGASKPDAFPTLLRALGADGDELPDKCAAVEGYAGYVACTSDAAVLAKYVPGKASAALRGTLAKDLGATELEDANSVFWVDDDDKRFVLSLATPPGLAHMTIGIPEAPPEMRRFLGSGPASALGLAAPGSGFYWLQLDAAEVVKQAEDQPFFVKNVIATLTGELFLGNLAKPGALVLLAGLSDPGPAGGLVALAGTQLDKIPKTLPDGTTLAAAVESVDLGGKEIQALHVTMTPPTEAGALLGSIGLIPEAWMFASGGYGGVIFGADKTGLSRVTGYTGSSMSSEAARALPKPMAQALVRGDTSFAVHLTVDSIQSTAVSEAFAMVAKTMPVDELPPGMTASNVLELVRTFMAPISGISSWMGPPADSMVFHMAISMPGDPRTPEGEAALAAMKAVDGGADAGTVYGALAKRFAGSRHAIAYETRAGSRQDGALSSMAILGMMTAIAVPAFAKYKARAAKASSTTEE